LSCYTTVGFVPTLGMLWLPPGRPAYIANGFAQGAGRLEIYPHLLPLHDGQGFRIVRISLSYQSVPDRLYFRFIGAQESVNENEHVGVVLVNILLIDAMVHSVGRRCVQEPLGNPELGHIWVCPTTPQRVDIVPTTTMIVGSRPRMGKREKNGILNNGASTGWRNATVKFISWLE